MKILESLKDWQCERREFDISGTRTKQNTIGFIPTMGALHNGHLSLVEQARRENNVVVASIFVNPTQFNNAEDLIKYPRDIARDIEFLHGHNVDYLLLPSESEMYEDQYRFRLSECEESKILCGAFRPGHFDGVLTVVMKLLNLVRANRCYMGEKDFQQMRLIKRMASTFFIETEIVACPIVRESSGLAMSSRNERLSAIGRVYASKLFETLKTADSSAIALRELSRLGFQVEYVEEHWGRRLAAVWFEGVRLIDNVSIHVSPTNNVEQGAATTTAGATP